MFDKYTKLMLTIIAVGIIGINIHIFKGSVIEDAYANANTGNDWQVVIPFQNHVYLFKDNGTMMCRIPNLNDAKFDKGIWKTTGC